MEFKSYQHIEKYGTSEVEGIEFGECFVFPKIDGTNASVWIGDDGNIEAGSRRRKLSIESDNAGFYAWVLDHEKLRDYLRDNPGHRLFGEWLVPHTLKTYRDDAWQRFYVFDVAVDKDESEIAHEGDSQIRYLHYNDYQPLLEKYGIDYIPPLAIIKSGSYEQFLYQVEKNGFLIEDGKGVGEGVVIKNYGFVNKYGRQTWAKIVKNEFKEKLHKEMGAPEIKGRKMVEAEIADMFVTQALVDKVYAKIENDGGFTSKQIPRLLNTVLYDVIREESWNFVKKFNEPTINFKTLRHFVFDAVKSKYPHLF